MVGHSEADGTDIMTDIQVFKIDVSNEIINDLYYKLTFAVLGQLRDAALLVTESVYFVFLMVIEETGNEKNTIYLGEYSAHAF